MQKLLLIAVNGINDIKPYEYTEYCVSLFLINHMAYIYIYIYIRTYTYNVLVISKYEYNILVITQV